MKTQNWNIDPTHSEVQFKVKHLVISTVTGAFKNFEGSLNTETEDFDGAKAAFSLDVKSIDTNVADRDAHLKSGDFFDAEAHPRLTFEGVLSKVSDEKYQLVGPMTIKETTQEVTLDVAFGGVMVDGYGQTKAGFEINGKINRKDFGLTWSAVTEAGGVVVGDDVKLLLNVQLVKN
ncbi:Polyisoprenoid-binding protein YceI [Reichenbachiella agariperforans]|uniref:Polyisoprenoid-binding protein YceI n=1 Tax=Reichenbachiella agariperforans TaxID=156994 RepID=A0A1M6RTV7_REIAG|nr:YceI family protein [Reichenbachiella agariperforans]SHK35951.1 Polyisoprenoid-binding protein YceI [Reichenbachiella agariperforans]